MGIHITRIGRSPAKVKYFLHPGEKVRPRPPRLSMAQKTSDQAKKASGTKGDFGEDFE